jgi:hypothetical protein
MMPAAYSVALESLTDLMVSEKEDVLAPIKDKKVAREIVAHLISELDRYAAQLDKDGLEVLKTRISNINQLTNKSKLIKPFELVHFTLSQEDLAAIEHRNDFLHGRITHLLDKKGKKKEITHIASSQEIYYTALRLYTLLAVLILKSIGYDNKIVNHPKIQRHNYSDAEMLKQLEGEDHFRQL